MLNGSIIPNYNSSGLPLDTSMEISAPSDMLKQEVEDGIRLFLLESNDASCN
jgi:hypothetical protein